MIIDLRYFNRFIRKVKFRVETIRSVVHVVNPGDVMATLDLKNAYLHIPIHPGSRKYIRITVQVSGVVKHLLLPFSLAFLLPLTLLPRWFCGGGFEASRTDHHSLSGRLALKASALAVLTQLLQVTISFLFHLGWIISW